jgi:hypothetical protein
MSARFISSKWYVTDILYESYGIYHYVELNMSYIYHYVELNMSYIYHYVELDMSYIYHYV